MTIHFIGAGPGAPDLITVRGRDLVARCPVCLYAGSLVPPEIVARAPPGARVIDTAPLDLDQIEAEFTRAHAADAAPAPRFPPTVTQAGGAVSRSYCPTSAFVGCRCESMMPSVTPRASM